MRSRSTPHAWQTSVLRPRRLCAYHAWPTSTGPMGVDMTCRNQLAKNTQTQKSENTQNPQKVLPGHVAGPICLVWCVCVALLACFKNESVLGSGGPGAQSRPAPTKPTQHDRENFFYDMCVRGLSYFVCGCVRTLAFIFCCGVVRTWTF